ncbi:MAG: MucB/RseB C-terminal domain-containing protein [Candidatus Competibacter denitrificans]
MKRPLLPWAIVVLAAGSALSTVCAQPVAEDAKQWLERMIHASQNLNYEGTFIYVQGPHVEAMRIVHGRTSEGERQRLTSLTGPPRDILVTSNALISLLPAPKATLLDSTYRHSRLPVSVAGDLGRLENRYDFQMEGESRVAGLEARVVAIKPRDALRYGYRLWLDRRDGMLLRSALLDEKGYPIEQLMFTDLHTKPQIDEALLRPPSAAEDPGSRPAPQTIVGNGEAAAGQPVTHSAWSVTHLPEGFVKILHNRVADAAGQHPTEHMVFADGLATVSVFIERLDGTSPLLQGESRLGSMNAFGTRLDNFQILVVGEVPAATVQTIASAISYAPQSPQSPQSPPNPTGEAKK